MTGALGPAAVRRARAGALEALGDDLRRFEPLRERYVEVVRETGVGSADNLLDPYAWTVYVHYTGFLERLLPGRDARVVDWGGLYGHVTALLRARGFERTTNYLLFRPDRYDDFRSAFGLPTVFGKDPNRLEVEDGGADCVISSGVLEHVREDGVGREDLVLADVRRALCPGGLFVAWHFPTFLAAADLIAKARGRWYHKYRYTTRDVRRLMAQARLDLVHLERHGGAPPSVALRMAGGDRARWMRWDLAWGGVPVARSTSQNHAFVAQRPRT